MRENRGERMSANEETTKKSEALSRQERIKTLRLQIERLESSALKPRRNGYILAEKATELDEEAHKEEDGDKRALLFLMVDALDNASLNFCGEAAEFSDQAGLMSEELEYLEDIGKENGDGVDK